MYHTPLSTTEGREGLPALEIPSQNPQVLQHGFVC